MPAHAALFEHLSATVQWDERLRARKTASFGVSYDYSGMTYPQTEMPEPLRLIAQQLKQVLGFEPNNCLLNYYPDGEASMGFHSDSSEELAEGTGVAIVSLGSPRELVFRLKADRSHQTGYVLEPGSLVYMTKELQSEWLHAIPKAPEAGPRISLTFRHLIKAAL
ncbi:alpha-ketoglutarate-dependent dioxygenase AlkB [Ideonella sp. DXS29W]|uniref:Alpha-ketoglutarate-dependent dioxygenase AlkB n=1 Tax=Ideonella lacteola TaxID=2984193 RepID=A0ABU9BIE0_9BURK